VTRDSLVKRWSRSVLETHQFDAARRAIVRREATIEQRFVEQTAQVVGVQALNSEFASRVAETHGGKTFFILGSGRSVTELSPPDFDLIRSNFSVGINAWALHSFVPDVYSYEPVPDRISDHFKTLAILGRDEVISRRPFVLILRPRTEIEREQIGQLHPTLRNRTYIYGRVTPATRLPANLPRDFQSTQGYLRDSGRMSVLVDSGASIVRMTSLGIRLGFRKIVYVGVDLNHSEYFWEKNPRFLEALGITSFKSGQTGAVHETMTPNNRPFNVIEMLRGIVAGCGGGTNSVQFFSGSSSSALADFLPIFEWRGQRPENENG
jgi:hypothetical protein